MRRENREFKRHQEGHFRSQEGTSFVKSQIERKKCIENSDFLPPNRIVILLEIIQLFLDL